MELGCAFWLEFRFLLVLIFRNSGYSAEFPEFRGTHVGIKSFQGKINLLRNSGSGIPEGRTPDLCHNTIPYYHSSVICPHHSMLPVVPGQPLSSSPLSAAVRRPRHSQPVDAETECQGRIRNIEFKVLMYTQLALLNNQRLRDFDTVVLINGPHIRKCRSAECMACIWEAKSFATQEIQGSEVVSPCKNLCLLHGYIWNSLFIFTHHSLYQTTYLLTCVMVRLLTSILRFLFDVLTIAILELSVVPLNTSCYHKTIQLTKMSMQTIATTNPLGGTLKEPMLYLRHIIPLAD